MSQDELMAHQQSMGQLSQASSAPAARRPLSLHIASNPGSPRLNPSNKFNSLRKAALVLRATQSTASLQSPMQWPAPSRSQSALALQPPTQMPTGPCCCCGHHDSGAPQYHRSPLGLAWRQLHYRTAKLKGVHRSAHLIAFFAMEAMAELQVNVPSTAPGWLFSLYAANTVLLITSNFFALMVSTCLLPRMSAISEEYDVDHLRAVPSFSMHDRLHGLVSLSAGLAHVLGLFLFLVEIILLNWVKFWDFSEPAALAGSLTMVPFLLLFVVTFFHFRKTLAEHACSTRMSRIEEVRIELKNVA